MFNYLIKINCVGKFLNLILIKENMIYIWNYVTYILRFYGVSNVNVPLQIFIDFMILHSLNIIIPFKNDS